MLGVKLQTTVGLFVVALAATVSGQMIILDDASPEFQILSGTWATSAAAPGYYGDHYLFRSTTSTGGALGEVEWRPNLPADGIYEVSVNYVAGTNRADNSPFTVQHRDGSTVVPVNQQINGRSWVSLGTYSFQAGTAGCVRLSNNANPSYVIADAVRFRDPSQVPSIAPDDGRVQIEGTLFSKSGPDATILQRFSDAMLGAPGGTFSADIARTASGIAVRFRTDSNRLTAVFTAVPGYQVPGLFSIYQNGVWSASPGTSEIDLISDHPGQVVSYRILCPPYESLSFLGLYLEPNATLYPVPSDHRPRYAAFGDSITHGGSSVPRTDQTYPWLLAEAKGWQVFNFGVGGSKVTPSFGAMLDHEPLDVATVLWGQNHVSSGNVSLFASDYAQFLTNLRQAHPTLAIYCITLTVGSSETAAWEEFRQAVRDLVAARQAAGDRHIHVIEGLAISTPADLRDSVHFSPTGAANVASRLAAIIQSPGGSVAFMDFDRDGDIDGQDMELFLPCRSGPDQTPSSSCPDKDLDGDSDVDQSDFGMIQGCLSGSGQPLDRTCVN